MPLGTLRLVAPSVGDAAAQLAEDRDDAADLVGAGGHRRQRQRRAELADARWLTIAISSSTVSGSGRTTVLKRRRSALDSSLMPRSRSLAVAIRLKPRTAATSVLSSGTGSDFSDRISDERVLDVGRHPGQLLDAGDRPARIARYTGLGTSAASLGPSASSRRVVPAVAQRLLGGAGGALHEQRRIAADRGREVLAHPGLGGAGHAEQQQRAVGGEGGDGDLHQPPPADVLGDDHRAVGERAAQQVGDDRPRRQAPARRPLAIVGGGQCRQFVRMLDLGVRA